MNLISRQAYILAFEDWLTALAVTESYAPAAKRVGLHLRALWDALPDGMHPPETFCALLEPLLLAVLDKTDLLMIWKSNYLYRRIYMGQRHRVNPCPVCRGLWKSHAVQQWVEVAGLTVLQPHPECRCGLTGWLP